MINGINQLYPEAMRQIQQVTEATPIHKEQEVNGKFTALLNDSIASLDSKQMEASDAVRSLVDGTADDLHTVMIKTTEAQISLEIAVQVRNRALEAFNEIKSMQF